MNESNHFIFIDIQRKPIISHHVSNLPSYLQEESSP